MLKKEVPKHKNIRSISLAKFDQNYALDQLLLKSPAYSKSKQFMIFWLKW